MGWEIHFYKSYFLCLSSPVHTTFSSVSDYEFSIGILFRSLIESVLFYVGSFYGQYLKSELAITYISGAFLSIDALCAKTI